jgi:hypothetical protein
MWCQRLTTAANVVRLLMKYSHNGAFLAVYI